MKRTIAELIKEALLNNGVKISKVVKNTTDYISLESDDNMITKLYVDKNAENKTDLNKVVQLPDRYESPMVSRGNPYLTLERYTTLYEVNLQLDALLKV